MLPHSQNLTPCSEQFFSVLGAVNCGGKIAHDCVTGTRPLGHAHKVRSLTHGTPCLVLNNFSQASEMRIAAEKSSIAAL